MFDTFRATAHPDAFNHAERAWTFGASNYPYVAKSTVNRGSDSGESNAVAPLTARDLQLHPPNNTHYVVAAFQVPQAGSYSVSGLAVRRVDANGGTVRLRLYGPAKTVLANLQATGSRAWARSTQTYALGNLAAGDYVYFAVDPEDGFGWDATEVDWLITAVTDGSPPPPPPAASCTISAQPALVPLGGSTTLSWTSSNASSLSVDQGVGALTPAAGGSITVTPAADTQYTATAVGSGGNGACAVSVTVSAALTQTFWRAYDATLQAGSPQGLLLDSSLSKSTQLEFYESSNAGVDRGVAFTTFIAGAHAESFSHAQSVWTNGTASFAFPFAAKSTVDRGSDTGESNAVAPLTARDLMLHPPSNGHYTVAAFRVPEAGSYSVSGLAVRRVDANGGTVRLRLYGPAKTVLANLQAGTNRAWTRSALTYDLGALNPGDYVYFALDAEDGFGWDAAELDWLITRTSGGP